MPSGEAIKSMASSHKTIDNIEVKVFYKNVILVVQNVYKMSTK